MDTKNRAYADYINLYNRNAEKDFPYLVLEVTNEDSSPRTPDFHIMHWHEDLQFVYVEHGSIGLKTLDSLSWVAAGEALFINKNVVHQILQKGDCRYNSFIFPDRFLSFYMGGPARAFVDNITEMGQLPFFHFDAGTSWCKEVFFLLQKLRALETEKTRLYVYEVLVLLSEIWLLICKNIAMPSEKKKSVTELRMRKFLDHIEKHYSEDLSLADLAKSADVSKSECLRCFKQSIGITPYKYLIEYRLAQATVLLKRTDDTIECIADKVGFRQTSNFGRYFREKTGLSPKDYRKCKTSENMMENGPSLALEQ